MTRLKLIQRASQKETTAGAHKARPSAYSGRGVARPRPFRLIQSSLALVAASALMGLSSSILAATKSSDLTFMKTTTGVEFGIWGQGDVKPSPTLIVLGNSIEGTIGEPYFRQAGNDLAKEGFISVSIDIPGHGTQEREGEAKGLAGWRERIDQGEDIVAETNRRLSEVLDYLIAEGISDPDNIAVSGTSRGGFLAMHFTASDPRVKCVAAFAPVTDLIVLREFHGAEGNALMESLSVSEQADKLADRPVWIIMGDRDDRVGTDNAITLARKITASAIAQGLNPAVDLLVLAEPKGHTTPAGAAETAAIWIKRQLGN